MFETCRSTVLRDRKSRCAISGLLAPAETSRATSRSRELAGLIEMLREDPPETVIPGHGPPFQAHEALSIAEADLSYLRSLNAVVVDALSRDVTRDEVRAAGLAVDLPRECPPDLEEMRGFNVDRQIDEILPAPAEAAAG
jgi:glyoxylase-like metal-dependent hydrolase (beta-lactamase superfamily II)